MDSPREQSKFKTVRDVLIIFGTCAGLPILAICVLGGFAEIWAIIASIIYLGAVSWFVYDKIRKKTLHEFLEYLVQKICDFFVASVVFLLMGSPIVIIIGIILKIVALVAMGVILLFVAVSLFLTIRRASLKKKERE